MHLLKMNIDGKQQSLLTFRVGPVLCCAPSMPVKSIITPPKLTHPPGSDTSQPGIFRHDAHIVKVIDLRQKFGVELADQTQPGNLIITNIGSDHVAFWVDQILDVFDFPATGWGNLPAAIPRGVFSRTLLLNKKIHLYSEFDKLASINDLGYLKHYIQQLHQTEINEEDSAKNSVADKNTPPEQKKTETEVTKVKKEPASFSEEKTSIKHEKYNSIVSSHVPTQTKPRSSINTPKAEAVTHKPLPRTTKTITQKSSSSSAIKSVHTPAVKKDTNIQNKIKSTSTTANTHHQPIAEINKVVPHNHFKKEVKETATARQITYSDNNNLEEDTESYFGAVVFFILLFSSIGAGMYYLLADIKNDIVKKHYKAENQYKEDRYNEEKYKTAQPITEVEPSYTSSNKINITDSLSGHVNDATSQIENNIGYESVPDVKSESFIDENYQANISQQDNEITITIHEPVSNTSSSAEEKVITQAITDEKIKHEVILDTAPVKPLTKNELPAIIPPEKIINEVIHIVVKGDTLWAIAKKYVNNPFRYPELARLSKIKNPHRIYPGNRVRIRFIKK